MSLATRCPACGTVFRVVSDQLKVSEGWVRCGRCAEVFNAAQQLFDLEQDAAAAPPPPRDPVAASAARARVGAALAPPSALPEPEPATAPEAQAAPEAAPAESTIDVPPVAAPDGDAASAAALAAPAPTPEFIRRADRAARWRQPARRGPLAALALLLAALLGAQIALHYRDRLAADWPGSRPGLLAACEVLGCRIEAPRRIDSLSVDSSGLVRLQDSPMYRLSLVLQNKSPTAVRMPAIELTLTDTQGQTLARRVLTVAELGQPVDSLPARGELALQAVLDLGDRRVAGYTVELFYP